MVKDFTDFFRDQGTRALNLVSNKGFLDTLTIFNSQSIQIYDLQYFNYLIVTKDNNIREKFLNNCSLDIASAINNISIVDRPVFKQQIKITPISLFGTYRNKYEHSAEEAALMNIYS